VELHKIMVNLTKSKKRIRDHGEVFTPDFIVNDMLDLVKNETERIESRFLEPACGDGNFLIEVIERKMNVVIKRYQKSQFDFERMMLIAASSIYGIELLDDNVVAARERLYNFCVSEYKDLYKSEVNQDVLKSLKYILKKNILQGNALNLKDKNDKPIIFSEWSSLNGTKIKRRDFQFVDLADFNPKKPSLFSVKEKSDTGNVVFSPQPAEEFKAVNIIKLHESFE